MEKISKEEIKEMAKEIAAVVAEDLQSQFKVFGEKLSDVEKKVDEVKKDTELLKEDMDYVKSTLVDNKDRFREVDEAMEKKAEKSMVSDHETRLSILENTAKAMS